MPARGALLSQRHQRSGSAVAIVSNASALILFARIGRLDLLQRVYGEIFIPPSVYGEVVDQGAGRAGAAEVASAPWIQTRPLRISIQESPLTLDVGERDAIALAQQEQLTVVLDDGAARRVAFGRGLVVTGSAGTLVRAKELGLIAVIRPVLDELVRAGLRLGAEPYARILAGAGEGERNERRQ